MSEATSPSETQLTLNRRELLNYAWLASLGVLLVNIGGISFLFSMPRFKEGEFGGTFSAEGKEADANTYGYAYLLGLMQARAAVAFIYGGLTSNDVTLSGSAFITSCNQTGPKNAERTWSATFRITGAVTEGTVA